MDSKWGKQTSHERYIRGKAVRAALRTKISQWQQLSGYAGYAIGLPGSGSDCNEYGKLKLVQLLEILLSDSMAKPLDSRPPQSRGSGGKAE